MEFETGKLVRDPGRYFDSPEDLLECNELSRHEKRTLLMCWFQDLVEQQCARQLGSRDGERPEVDSTAEQLREVATALTRLDHTIH